MHVDPIYTITVWGQHTSLAGKVAHVDVTDDSENMDDYEIFSGTAAELLELADQLGSRDDSFSRRVACLIREELE